MADLGDYYASVTNIAGSGSAQNLVSIENPSASTATLLVKNVEVIAASTLTTALTFFYNATRLTTIPTGGTSQSVQKNSSTSPAAQAIVRLTPTGFVAAAGSYWTGSPGSALLIGVPLTGITALPGWIGRPIDLSQRGTSIVLVAGEGLLIKVDANSALWTHGVNLHWFEQDAS